MPWILLGANCEFMYLINNNFFNNIEVNVNSFIFITVGLTWLAYRFTTGLLLRFVGKIVIADSFYLLI